MRLDGVENVKLGLGRRGNRERETRRTHLLKDRCEDLIEEILLDHDLCLSRMLRIRRFDRFARLRSRGPHAAERKEHYRRADKNADQ
jgi:hypothetical protein